MKEIIYTLSLVVLICGCSPKIATERVKTEYIDKEILRDTIIYVPIYKETLVNRVKDTTSHLKNKFSESTAYVDTTGYLNHCLATIPQDVPFKVVYKDKLVIQRDSIDRPYPVKGDKIIKEVVPIWCWWLLGVFCLLIIIIILAIILKIKKIAKGVLFGKRN